MTNLDLTKRPRDGGDRKIKKFDQAIFATRGKNLAVWAECHIVDGVTMVAEHQQRPPTPALQSVTRKHTHLNPNENEVIFLNK